MLENGLIILTFVRQKKFNTHGSRRRAHHFSSPHQLFFLFKKKIIKKNNNNFKTKIQKKIQKKVFIYIKNPVWVSLVVEFIVLKTL